MARVKGLDLFLTHFKGFEEQYVLIGVGPSGPRLDNVL